MAKYYLVTDAPRPPFWLIITFLWSDDHNVDTDGDARHPDSNDWTDLYCRDRGKPSDIFEVEVISGERPHIVIESTSEELAARVALFLSTEMEVEGPLSKAELSEKCGRDFDIDAAFERAKHSRWRRATEDDPYPAG